MVNAQFRQPFSIYWGDGSTSSSDGQNLELQCGGRGQASGQVNLKYGQGPGVQFYTRISDQYAPFPTKIINATMRDATHVHNGLLYHESDLRIEGHYKTTIDSIFLISYSWIRFWKNSTTLVLGDREGFMSNLMMPSQPFLFSPPTETRIIEAICKRKSSRWLSNLLPLELVGEHDRNSLERFHPSNLVGLASTLSGPLRLTRGPFKNDRGGALEDRRSFAGNARSTKIRRIRTQHPASLDAGLCKMGAFDLKDRRKHLTSDYSGCRQQKNEGRSTE